MQFFNSFNQFFMIFNDFCICCFGIWCKSCFLYFPLGKYKKLVLHCFGKLMGMLKHGAIPKKCPCGISGTNPYLSDSDGYEWLLKFQSDALRSFCKKSASSANRKPSLHDFRLLVFMVLIGFKLVLRVLLSPSIDF